MLLCLSLVCVLVFSGCNSSRPEEQSLIVEKVSNSAVSPSGDLLCRGLASSHRFKAIDSVCTTRGVCSEIFWVSESHEAVCYRTEQDCSQELSIVCGPPLISAKESTLPAGQILRSNGLTCSSVCKGLGGCSDSVCTFENFCSGGVSFSSYEKHILCLSGTADCAGLPVPCHSSTGGRLAEEILPHPDRPSVARRMDEENMEIPNCASGAVRSERKYQVLQNSGVCAWACMNAGNSYCQEHGSSFCQSWEKEPTCFGIFRISENHFCFKHPDTPLLGDNCPRGVELKPVLCPGEITMVQSFQVRGTREGDYPHRFAADTPRILQQRNSTSFLTKKLGIDFRNIRSWAGDEAVRVSTVIDEEAPTEKRWWSEGPVNRPSALPLQKEGWVSEWNEKYIGDISLYVGDASFDSIHRPVGLMSEISNLNDRLIWLSYDCLPDGEFIANTESKLIDFVGNVEKFILSFSGIEEKSIGIQFRGLLENFHFSFLFNFFSHKDFFPIRVVVDLEETPNSQASLMLALDRADEVIFVVRGNSVQLIEHNIKVIFDRIDKKPFHAKIGFMLETSCELQSGCSSLSFCGIKNGSLQDYFDTVLDTLTDNIANSSLSHSYADQLFSVNDGEWFSCYGDITSSYSPLCHELEVFRRKCANTP